MTGEQVAALLAADDDETLMSVVEEIEEAWDADNLAECDKSWDAMHRALTDGQLGYGNGPYPLNCCVLGPKQLHEGDDYIVSLVNAEQVQDVAAALKPLGEEWFRHRYRTIVPKDYAPEYGDQDMEYTWEYLQAVGELYRKAASAGRAMVFTVDQ
ncbi:MAG: DUF1877 family protein [Planctomycetes bacterium]|nr:DUF1877 family protein [Planctomycetota bacterium]